MTEDSASRLSGLWCRLRVSAWQMIQENFWGLADRGMTSASNFVTVVVLARALGAVAFGIFAVVYSTVSLASRLQNSLVNQPQAVFGSTREGESYVEFTTITLVSQVLLAILTGLLVLVAAAISWWIGTVYTPLVLTLAPVVVFWQIQGYLTTVMYTENRLRSAFFNDSISFLAQAVIFVVLWRLGGLTGTLAFDIIAVTSLVASVVGIWQIRRSIGRKLDWSILSGNWHLGKWLSAAELATWLWTDAYLYLTAALLGPAAAGILKAVDALFGPLRIILSYLWTILPIRFARRYASEGSDGLWSSMKSAHGMLVPIVGGYCLLLAVFASPASRLVFGNGYSEVGHVLALYGVYVFFTALAVVVISGLNVRLLSRSVFTAQAIAASAALPLGWVLIKLIGLDGAIASMIFAAVFARLLNWIAFLRHPAAPSAEADEAPAPAVEAGRAKVREFELGLELETPGE